MSSYRVIVTDDEGTALDSFEVDADELPEPVDDKAPTIARLVVLEVARDIRLGLS